MRRFRARSGVIELRLRRDDIHALSLMGTVLESVGRESGDPAAQRLSVAAYPEDPDAQSEYGRFMAPQLEGQRQVDRAAVTSSLQAAREGPVKLTTGEAESWLMVVNEARLTLAARLGIEEEGWGETHDAGRPPAPGMVLLIYLTGVQDDLIQAMGDHLWATQ